MYPARKPMQSLWYTLRLGSEADRMTNLESSGDDAPYNGLARKNTLIVAAISPKSKFSAVSRCRLAAAGTDGKGQGGFGFVDLRPGVAQLGYESGGPPMAMRPRPKTGLTTKMTRLYGRSPRGERLVRG